MARKKEELSFNPFEQGKDRESLLAYRKHLASIANKRMRRLEKATSKVTGKELTAGAYQRYAEPYLKGKGRRRFSEALRQGNLNSVKHEILVLEKFLNAKSSTVSGFREIEKERQRNIAERVKAVTGRELTLTDSKDFYKFLQSGLYKYAKSTGLDSSKIMEKYDARREQGMSHEQIMDAFEEWRADEKKPKTEKDLDRLLDLKEL